MSGNATATPPPAGISAQKLFRFVFSNHHVESAVRGRAEVHSRDAQSKRANPSTLSSSRGGLQAEE